MFYQSLVESCEPVTILELLIFDFVSSVLGLGFTLLFREINSNP